MAYCAQTDLLKSIREADLIELTDDAGAGEVDTDAVDQAIADADATINAYCQSRYSVPFTTTPDMIRKLSVDLAIYNLYALLDDKVPDVRKENKSDAIKFLTRVADGKMDLGVESLVQDNTDNTVDITCETAIFTRTNMSGF